jgi:hypothetical protein
MTGRLLAAGCPRLDPLGNLPPGVTDRKPRAGDEAFQHVTGRRPVVEHAIAMAAREEPGLVIRRGVQVTALTGIPHVTGVRTSGGEELRADLAVDAMGRSSRSTELLRDVECFTRGGAGLPVRAHWLDGEPITDVRPHAGIMDRYLRFVVDGDPVVREHLGDLAGFAQAWDEGTERLAPFYWNQIDTDRARVAEMTALRSTHRVLGVVSAAA